MPEETSRALVDHPRVMIVGGGFGGIAAARALRRAEADVVLIDRQNHHLFQPLLYQVATAVLSPAQIAAPIRRILRGQQNCRVAMVEAKNVDLAARKVELSGERYGYEYLVIAAGMRHSFFGHPEWEEAAPGLKTIDEATGIRARILLAFEQAELEWDAEAQRKALTFAIVGAGSTGVELAGALSEIGRMTLRKDFRRIDTGTLRVILVDGADRVLPDFPEQLSERAERDLRKMGVEIRLRTRLVELEANRLTVEGPDGTESIDAGNILWAAGVQAAAIAETLDAEGDNSGRLVVGDDLSIPGHPEVFAVGDIAHRVDPRSQKEVPGVAQGALQMGDFVGRQIAREIEARQQGRPLPDRGTFVYSDRGSLATIGRSRAVAQMGSMRFGGTIAWLLWAFIHVFFLIGFSTRVIVMLEWTWTYLTGGRNARLITGKDRAPILVRPPPEREPAGHDAEGDSSARDPQ